MRPQDGSCSDCFVTMASFLLRLPSPSFLSSPGSLVRSNLWDCWGGIGGEGRGCERPFTSPIKTKNVLHDGPTPFFFFFFFDYDFSSFFVVFPVPVVSSVFVDGTGRVGVSRVRVAAPSVVAGGAAVGLTVVDTPPSWRRDADRRGPQSHPSGIARVEDSFV